jgi:Ca-activated chloride channel family protein
MKLIDKILNLEVRSWKLDNSSLTSSIQLLTSFLFFAVIPVVAYSQQERKPVRDGNALYQQKKYAEAEQKYDEALKLKPNLVEGIYNKANIQYQKKEYEEAAKQYETAAALSSDPTVKAKAYHNMGNAYLEAGKYKEGVDAYKNALKLNPADADTKYNLAYALQKLKQEQSQNKQNEQNKDQNKDNKDDKNQQQNQDNQKQDQQNKDQQQQNKQDQQQEQKNQQQQQSEQQQAEKNEEKKAEPRQAQISKADADKLLDALKNEEQKVQLKLQKHKGEATSGKVEKDW